MARIPEQDVICQAFVTRHLQAVRANGQDKAHIPERDTIGEARVAHKRDKDAIHDPKNHNHVQDAIGRAHVVQIQEEDVIDELYPVSDNHKDHIHEEGRETWAVYSFDKSFTRTTATAAAE